MNRGQSRLGGGSPSPTRNRSRVLGGWSSRCPETEDETKAQGRGYRCLQVPSWSEPGLRTPGPGLLASRLLLSEIQTGPPALYLGWGFPECQGLKQGPHGFSSVRARPPQRVRAEPGKGP